MWKCIFSSTTNRGVGCNREPQDGEFARDIHPSECAWFMSDPSRYLWDGSKLVEFPGWADEVAQKELSDAKAETKLLIVAEEDSWSWKPFPYGETVMKATRAISDTVERFRAMADEDPVPMLNGHWNDANNVPVPMTMGGLRGLKDDLYDRAMDNYGVSMYHQNNVDALTTLEEVRGYNYKTGWR